MEERDDWAEIAAGAVAIGSAPKVGISIPRWHWRMLAFLEREQGVDIAAALAEVRALAPGASPDEIVTWYVEAAYEALLFIESEDEDDNDALTDSAATD